MFIKAGNSKNVVNMDDYALIESLPDYLIDDFYTKEYIDAIVTGNIELEGYVSDNELAKAFSDFVEGIAIQYRASDDNMNPPSHDELWEENLVWSNDKYIWQRYVLNFNDGETYYSSPICVSGAKGNEGEKGQSLTNIVPQWCLNNDGNWNNFIPELTEYDTIWIRYELHWENPNDITYTSEVQDIIYEKIKELFDKMTTVEDIQKDIDIIKEDMLKLEEGCATKEELKDSINADRINLFRNGDFYDGQEFWTVYGRNNIPRLQENIRDYPYGKAMIIRGELTYTQYITQAIVPMTNMVDQEYTVSCLVNCDSAADGLDMPLYSLKVEVYHGKNVIGEIFADVEHFDSEWHKLSTTFKVSQEYDYFDCSFYVRDTTKTVKLTGFMFEQGNVANPFQINIRELQERIPKQISDLENNVDFITEEEVLKMLEGVDISGSTGGSNVDLSDYALKTDIPINLSELNNDMNFLTEHQDISHLASKSDLPILPTKLSELDNDVNFISYNDLDYEDCAYVSVEAYGIQAGLDVDVEENTRKFQKMIDDCKNTKVIMFPAGDFVFNSIDLGTKNNITIIGISSSFGSFAQKDINTGEITDTFTRIICNEEGGKTFFTHKNCVLVLDRIAFYNLAKDENGLFIDNQEAKDCIFIKHTRSEGAKKNTEKGKIFATDCAFYGWKVVFGCEFTMQHLEDEWGTGLISSNYESEEDTGLDGVGYYKQSCVMANRCRFTRNGVGVNQTVDGRLIDCSFNKNDYGIIFRLNSGFSSVIGCRIEWNNYNGIYCKDAHEVIISECEFDCNGWAGLYAEHNTCSNFINSIYRRNGAHVESTEDESHKEDYEKNVHIYAKENIDCNFIGNNTVVKATSDVGSAPERPSNACSFVANSYCIIKMNNWNGTSRDLENKSAGVYFDNNEKCITSSNIPDLSEDSINDLQAQINELRSIIEELKNNISE